MNEIAWLVAVFSVLSAALLVLAWGLVHGLWNAASAAAGWLRRALGDANTHKRAGETGNEDGDADMSDLRSGDQSEERRLLLRFRTSRRQPKRRRF